MNRTILTILFILSGLVVKATTLSGIISDEKGKPLSYAVVFIKGTSDGVTANGDGKYQLQLSAGNYEIVFQYVGYEKKTEKVTIGESPVTLNVKMKAENFSLKGVTVYSDAEDPAYRIIRAAIKRRKSYLEQVKEYSCKVYIKGVENLDSLPKRIMGLKLSSLGIDSSQLGIVYLSESESEYNFRQPARVREIMVSSKVSGNNKAFSYNQASDFDCNFYKNLIEIPDLADRGFVSPISESAMFYYKYELIGTRYEDNELVNKIKVTPKRPHDPVFRGYIYIVENSWRIHSTDLYLTKDANIDFVDSLDVKQTYNKVTDSVYMPFNQVLLFNFRFLGIKGHGRYIGSFNNYNVHPDFPKHFFKGEELKVNEDANKKDTVYWKENRPIQLTQEEAKDYRIKDSLELIHNSKKYLDSIDRKRNKFGFTDLFNGYHCYKRYSKINYSIGGILNFINYNTVEGWAPIIPLTFQKSRVDYRSIYMSADLRYGTSNQLFSARGNAYYNFSPAHSSYVGIAGGKYVQQINENEPISPLINTIYTLIEKENYMKLYDDTYIKALFGTEIVNGIKINTYLSYALHSPLENTTSYTWSGKPGDSFTPNYPYFSSTQTNFTAYKTLQAYVSAVIHFKQRYYTMPHRKVIIGSKFPALTLSYKKGINALGSNSDFDEVTGKISYDWKMGLVGHSALSIKGGDFINNNNVGIAELMHFNGNQTFFAPLDHMDAFQLLPYYRYSTSRYFAEGHFEHHFEGFLLNKIPGLRNLKLHEVIGVHYLYTPAINYTEFSVGLENIFKVLRLDFVTSYSNTLKLQSGFLIGLDLFGVAR